MTPADLTALEQRAWSVSYIFDANPPPDTPSAYYLLKRADTQETLDPASASYADEIATLLAEVTPATVGAWVELRMIRDRWLAQTDYIEVFLSGGFSPLPQAIQDALTANKDGWLGWRQSLRDLPAAAGLDPFVTVSTAAHIHSTADTFSLPWPQPPAAPVIHLT